MPRVYLLRIVIFLVLILSALAVVLPRVQDAFLANTFLNSIIVGVLLFGIAYVIQRILFLRREFHYLSFLKKERLDAAVISSELEADDSSRLLGPLFKVLREKRGKVVLSAVAMRALQDSIETRIDEAHAISRYLIGLLVFLGLLGTFWGLLETVSSVGETIGAMQIGSGEDPSIWFESLRRGLEGPLSGMGTAFSTSLFGLAGSLVLGFIELQSSQAHNRFLNDLEEWLSGLTRLSGGSLVSGEGEGEASFPAYLGALLEQSSESIDKLQRLVARGEDERAQTSRRVESLTEKLAILTDQMRKEQDVTQRLMETNQAIRHLFEKIDEASGFGGGMDETSLTHIRNMDLHLERIATEMGSGRERVIDEIRSEIRLLARTIAAIAEETE